MYLSPKHICIDWLLNVPTHSMNICTYLILEVNAHVAIKDGKLLFTKTSACVKGYIYLLNSPENIVFMRV